MPHIPESCYERDERRTVLLLPAVWEREQGHISRSGGAEGVSGGTGFQYQNMDQPEKVKGLGPREAQGDDNGGDEDDDDNDDVIRNLQSGFASLVQVEAARSLRAFAMRITRFSTTSMLDGNIREATPFTLDNGDF